MGREQLNKPSKKGWELAMRIPMRRVYQEKSVQRPPGSLYLMCFRNKVSCRQGTLMGRAAGDVVGNVRGPHSCRVL